MNTRESIKVGVVIQEKQNKTVQDERSNNVISSSLSISRNSLAEACRNRYGDVKGFISTFTPEKQYVYCLHQDRCFSGSAPTLSVVSKCYGFNVAKSFVSGQIKDLMEYTGCRDKMSIRQIDAASNVIVSSYFYLKVTELMFFFFQFKAGRYGTFYGQVDAIKITEALRSFLKFRNETLDAIERKNTQERKERMMEEAAKNAISYEEWKRRQSAVEERSDI